MLDADGNDCFPFKDDVGQLYNYPQSQLNQCVKPSITGGVCAFKYTEVSVCQSRPYTLVSYESSDAAVADNATVTHEGPCGVCSNANDLSVRMKHINDLQSYTVACAVYYVLSGSSSDRFAELEKCLIKEIGFTQPCVELWAHYSATNAALCASNCAPGASGEVELNGAAPECALSSCLQCSANRFQDTFNALSGRTLANSGITEAIARPCSSFFPVNHDPCPMVDPSISEGATGTGAALAPSTATQSPGSSSAEQIQKSISLVLGIVLVTLLLSLQ